MMVVRPLLEDDIVAADAAAWAALSPLYPDGAAPDEAVRAPRAHLRIDHCRRQDPEGAWVAEADGTVIGIALAIVREDVWGLSLLGVHPDHQSKGVGRALLDATLVYAEGRRGAIILSSEDPRAMRRYFRAGFALRPCVCLHGIADRSTLPAGLRSRPGSAVDDRELCDAASRHVRGAAHGPDLEAFVGAGSRLFVHDDGGWAALRDGQVACLAARDEAIARDLLWTVLAEAGTGVTLSVD